MDSFLINEQAQQIHTQRRKDLLKRYPEVKALFGSYPWSALLIAGLVALQWTVAWLLRAQPWSVIVLVSYLGGAVLNHALYVLMHEATHNLIFKPPVFNKICGLLCDFALMIPSAMSFRKYHLLHHHHLKPTVSPLIIPLLYCHINGFQRAFSMEKPLPGGEKRMAGWAAHPVAW